MNLFGTIALMLLTLVGYSSGAVIAGRNRKRSPRLLDLGMVILLLAMALATRSMFGKWIATPFWLVAACLVSALLTKVRYVDCAATEETNQTLAEKDSLRLAWEWWKAFSVDFGNYQGRILFAFFYFIVVTPFGIGVRLFRNPLGMNQGGKTSCWLERSLTNQRPKEIWEQF